MILFIGGTLSIKSKSLAIENKSSILSKYMKYSKRTLLTYKFLFARIDICSAHPKVKSRRPTHIPPFIHT